MATGWPVAKILIKYNSNNLEENNKEEKEPINIELTDQKADPYNDENTIDFRWSYVKWKILFWLTLLRACKRKTDEEIFPKK